MSHSKTPKKTKPARDKSRTKGRARSENIRVGSTRSGTKQEAVLALRAAYNGRLELAGTSAIRPRRGALRSTSARPGRSAHRAGRGSLP
jgi:hypothetical protein